MLADRGLALDAFKAEVSASRKDPTAMRLAGGVPNFEPRDDIKIRETAPIITSIDDGVDLTMMTWGWKGPGGKPVFNFRSDGQSFANLTRA